MCLHVALYSANKLFKQYKPDRVVFAFEGGNNWRKEYTKNAISGVGYKANRVQDKSMEHLFELIKDFKDVMANYTSNVVLAVPGLEGDDVIGGYVQTYASPNDTIYVVSADRDFIQLLKYPNTYLVDPNTGKFRNQPGDKDYCEDIDYFMFLKCVRGDGGDNVPSAFPRVRESKIRAAYEDSYHRENFMNTTWEKPCIDENGNPYKQTMRVGDLFVENQMLMDLSKQPTEIREYMLEQVKATVENPGKYNNFRMLQFLGKHKLNQILNKLNDFIPMFACGQSTRIRLDELNTTQKNTPIVDDVIAFE
jgi:hypothetical protein